MNKSIYVVLSVILCSFVMCSKPSSDQEIIIKVKPGLEVFFEEYVHLIKGKRVGLVSNPTGVDKDLCSAVELFSNHPDVNLVALYGPEHGVRGNAQAGEYVPFYMDDKYGIPVFSLYGQSRKPDSGMLKNIDEYMRTFDTKEDGKTPDKFMVQDIEVLVFDIQDVGTRIYTYIATMAYCMQVCAENKVEFIVLDRPNPINGITLEGPLLEFPKFSTFVGLYPIPVRHGMTVGELAGMFNDLFLTRKVELTVIPMKGWDRSMWFNDTGLPWVIPSPNMPTLDTATVYPGQVYIEGTNVSEGRGTTKPFELFGAPWIDGNELTKKLNSLDLPSVKFRETWFSPIFSKYQGELCGGAQIHVNDRNSFKSFETSLYIITMIRSMYPDRFRFHEKYFDNIMGTDKIRFSLEKNMEIDQIIKQYEADLMEFMVRRKPYLLY